MKQLFYEQVNGHPVPPPTSWIAYRCALHDHIFYAKAHETKPRCPVCGSPTRT